MSLLTQVSNTSENIKVSQYAKLSHLTHFLSVRWHTGTKWHTLVHGVSSHGQKMSQMTQFYALTHFHVFCVITCKIFVQNIIFYITTLLITFIIKWIMNVIRSMYFGEYKITRTTGKRKRKRTQNLNLKCIYFVSNFLASQPYVAFWSGDMWQVTVDSTSRLSDGSLIQAGMFIQLTLRLYKLLSILDKPDH